MSGRVHIVDDDTSFRNALDRRLKQAGYEVETYASALHLLVNLPTEERTETFYPAGGTSKEPQPGTASCSCGPA